MKKIYYSLLIILSVCIASCKKNTSSDISIRHNTASINYGNESDYEYLYNQLYATIAAIKDDSLLNTIVETEFLYTDVTLDDIINSDRYSDLEGTFTSIRINEIATAFFGFSIEAMPYPEYVLTTHFQSLMETDYIEPSDLYNYITLNDLSEGDIFMLYFMSAAYNYMQEQGKVCIIAIEDAYERRIGIYPIRDFPQLPCSNEPIIWYINVEDVHVWDSENIIELFNPDSHIDSTRMGSFESIGYYVTEWFSEGGSTYADAADCYLEWMYERDRIRAECYERIEAIAASGCSVESMRTLMNATIAIMYAKLEATDRRLYACLAAVYLNNNQQQQ